MEEYLINKSTYLTDIYTSIKMIDDLRELDLKQIVFNDEYKIFIFVDILNKTIIKYDGNGKITKQEFKTDELLLNYFEVLKVKYKDNENIYLRYLEDNIKDLKIYISSKKPNKIKEVKHENTILKLNTILYTSWGYDQTNIEMFRIVKFLGNNYFIIQEIGQETIEESQGFMCCNVKAGTQDLKKLPIKAFIDNNGYMSICESGYKRSLFIDEKEQHYKSWYA